MLQVYGSDFKFPGMIQFMPDHVATWLEERIKANPERYLRVAAKAGTHCIIVTFPYETK